MVLCVALIGAYAYGQQQQPSKLSTIKVKDDLFVIHNRRDLAFAPDYLSFTYDANDLTLDLLSASLHYQPNTGVTGWTLDFDRAATVSRPSDAPGSLGR